MQARGAYAPGAGPGNSGGGEPGSGQLQEPALLAQLVQLLGQRPRHSLLLSDLGALLPGPLRHGVKEKGGLRSWLQKYPELFQVSGHPGKESVTLLLGMTGDRTAAGSTGANAARQPNKAAVEATGADAGAAGQSKKDDEDEENEAAVQMRGLPYRATVSDVKRFLGVHLRSLKDEASIQLVANRDGRPSGFARVQFDSPASAKAARDGLHMQVMEIANTSPGSTGGTGSGAQDRYVEVFLYSERPNKLRIKRLTGGGATGISEEEAAEASKVSKEQVVSECREHMMSPGKGQLLLSMLGVALSDGARLYLKKTDQGLKQFLAQYPHEFTVDGVKGRECVSYLPALAKGSQNNSDLPVGFPEAQKKTRRAEQGTGGPASGSINDLQRGSINDLQRFQRREEPVCVPQSPKVTDTPQEFPTPSDWGTPQPAAYLPGYDPIRSTTMPPKAGPDANAAAPSQRLGGQGMEDWAAWAMPPPSFWPDPACWSQEAAAPMPPWGAVDGQALGVLQPMPAAGLIAAMPAAMPLVPSQAQAQPAPSQPSQDSAAPAAVRLQGLPFTATEQDVLAFFAKHDVVDRVSEAPNAVNIIKKANGKHTGQAIVHMMSRTDAHVALRVLNGQYMDSRYIEVSHYTEGSQGPAQPGCVGTIGSHAAVDSTAVPAGASMPGAGAILSAVGVVQAQGVFDGASDTGGSGGAAGAGNMVPAFPQPVWWAAPAAAAEAAAKAQAPPASDGAPPAGADEETERWEALFNFLKRDGEPAPMPSSAI